MATLLAVSLVSATPVWAAKNSNGNDSSPEREKLKHQLMLQSDESLTVGQNWKQSAEKLDMLLKNAKKKSVAIEKLPKDVEEALEKLYQSFPNLKDLKLDRVEIITESNDQPEMWYYSFNKEVIKKEGNKNVTTYISASVLVEAKTENVVSYSYYDSGAKNTKTPTEKVAKEKASSFLSKVLGDEAEKFKITDVFITQEEIDNESRGYAYVNFSRLIHDIPLSNMGVSIVINGDGQIESYNCDLRLNNIDESDFPNPNKAIKKKDAEKAFEELSDLKLVYAKEQVIEMDTKKNKYKTKPVLKYVPGFNGHIDALTGEEIEYYYGKYETPETVKLSAKGEEIILKSRQDAEEFLKDKFDLDVSSWNFREKEYDSLDKKVKRFSWDQGTDERSQLVIISIDQKTGKLLDYINRDVLEDKQPEIKISKEEAKEQAIQAIEKFAEKSVTEGELALVGSPTFENIPDWVDEDKLPNIIRQGYYFRFNQLHQNVPVEDSSYRVQIDAETGEIVRLNFSDDYDNSVLPANEDTVTKQKATDAYTDNLSLEMMYQYPEYYGQVAPEPILVYYSKDKKTGYIDAFTGKIVEIKVK